MVKQLDEKSLWDLRTVIITRYDAEAHAEAQQQAKERRAKLKQDRAKEKKDALMAQREEKKKKKSSEILAKSNDLSVATVLKLKSYCRAANLSVSGKKGDIIQRLQDAQITSISDGEEYIAKQSETTLLLGLIQVFCLFCKPHTRFCER